MLRKPIDQADDGLGWIRLKAFRVRVTPLTSEQIPPLIFGSKGKRLLLNHNLHSLYLHEVDDQFRLLYSKADWIIVDGAPVLWLAALSAKRRIPSKFRVSSTDWLGAITSLDASGRIFVFGATAQSNLRAIAELRRRLPTWQISGIDGYVDDETALSHMVEFKPDIVIVGLGMPRQEYFLLRNFPRLPDATYATVGGAIDYVAGVTELAPRWIGRFGMEWLWRLVHEPRRLAYRYLVEPGLLLLRLLSRWLRSSKTEKQHEQ